MVISFSHDTAFEQLTDHGEAVTFRATRRKNPNGRTWVNRGRGRSKELDVRIEEIGEAHPDYETLVNHVELSGFEDVGEWIQAIRELNDPGVDTGYLYRVTKVEDTDG